VPQDGENLLFRESTPSHHEADAGRKVDELCRAHGVARHTYYRWKAKYGGLQLIEA
jgi:hypothetical protein